MTIAPRRQMQYPSSLHSQLPAGNWKRSHAPVSLLIQRRRRVPAGHLFSIDSVRQLPGSRRTITSQPSIYPAPSTILDLHAPLLDCELSDPTNGRSAAKTNGNV